MTDKIARIPFLMNPPFLPTNLTIFKENIAHFFAEM